MGMGPAGNIWPTLALGPCESRTALAPSHLVATVLKTAFTKRQIRMLLSGDYPQYSRTYQVSIATARRYATLIRNQREEIKVVE